MHKITASLAVLALVGASAASVPAMAQSTTTTMTNNRGGVDCSLPTNSDNPYCIRLRGQGGTGNGSGGPNNGPGRGPNNSAQGGPGGNGQGSPAGNAQPSPNNLAGPPSGTWNWSPQYRDQFHQRFRGFNFGTFGAPTFSLSIGVGVPGSYYHYLRPVPRSIYRYYPWFRGYLYFVGRGGEFVIVSPRTHRIVAVI